MVQTQCEQGVADQIAGRRAGQLIGSDDDLLRQRLKPGQGLRRDLAPLGRSRKRGGQPGQAGGQGLIRRQERFQDGGNPRRLGRVQQLGRSTWPSRFGRRSQGGNRGPSLPGCRLRLIQPQQDPPVPHFDLDLHLFPDRHGSDERGGSERDALDQKHQRAVVQHVQDRGPNRFARPQQRLPVPLAGQPERIG